jgi:pseudouridine-5'-phosphate glycosidase
VIRFTAEVAEALEQDRAVVALESSVFAQGLPIPANREALRRMVLALSTRGVQPAVSAVVAGQATFGLTLDEMERFLRRDNVRKLSGRDLASAILDGADGATTVSGTLALLVLTPIQVFATGGIGGVHREPAFDESADLVELSRTPAIVVCAGAKSILNLAGTLERLETLGVPVVGYQTDEMPGFLTRETGLWLGARVDSPEGVARLFQIHRALGRRQSLVVMQPPPSHLALPRLVVERAVEGALEHARREGARGAALTPRLLSAIDHATGGRSLDANVVLLEENAALAAEIAIALRRELNGFVAGVPRSG